MHRLLLFPFIALLAGCSLLVSPDPQAAENYRLQAEEAIWQKDYAAAADLLARAAARAPKDGSIYLRQGELLERIARFPEARRIYRRGLKHVEVPAERQALAWRLGLLYALRFENSAGTQALMAELPAENPARADLEGILSLVDGEPRIAIAGFNQALASAVDNDLKAAVYYHAALAYRRLGDEKNTFGALFHAINHAEHLGLVGQIEQLWNELNDDSPGP